MQILLPEQKNLPEDKGIQTTLNNAVTKTVEQVEKTPKGQYDALGWNAAVYAAVRGNYRRLSFLLNYMPALAESIMAVGDVGSTLLMYASDGEGAKNEDLPRSNPNHTQSLKVIFAAFNRLGKDKEWVKNFVNLNITELRRGPCRGMGALDYATRSLNVDSVQLLCTAGANPFKKENNNCPFEWITEEMKDIGESSKDRPAFLAIRQIFMRTEYGQAMDFRMNSPVSDTDDSSDSEQSEGVPSPVASSNNSSVPMETGKESLPTSVELPPKLSLTMPEPESALSIPVSQEIPGTSRKRKREEGPEDKEEVHVETPKKEFDFSFLRNIKPAGNQSNNSSNGNGKETKVPSPILKSPGSISPPNKRQKTVKFSPEVTKEGAGVVGFDTPATPNKRVKFVVEPHGELKGWSGDSVARPMETSSSNSSPKFALGQQRSPELSLGQQGPGIVLSSPVRFLPPLPELPPDLLESSKLTSGMGSASPMQLSSPASVLNFLSTSPSTPASRQGSNNGVYSARPNKGSAESNGISPSQSNGNSPAQPMVVSQIKPNGISPTRPNGTSPAQPSGVSPARPNGISPARPNGTSPLTSVSGLSTLAEASSQFSPAQQFKHFTVTPEQDWSLQVEPMRISPHQQVYTLTVERKPTQQLNFASSNNGGRGRSQTFFGQPNFHQEPLQSAIQKSSSSNGSTATKMLM